MGDFEQQKRMKKLCVSGLRDVETLFGRDKETEILYEIRSRLLAVEDTEHHNDNTSNTHDVVWVHGASGSGKTALCRQLNKGALVSASRNNATTKMEEQSNPGDNDNQTRHFYFVEGKFDQHQDYSIPYSALVQALDSLGQQIPQSSADGTNNNTVHNDMLHLQQALQHEGSVLRELVPTFANVEDPPPQDNESDETSPTYDNSNETKPDQADQQQKNARIKETRTNDDKQHESNVVVEESLTSRLTAPAESSSLRISQNLDMATQRVALALGAFIKEFCTASQRSLIFFVDDIQWGDQNSLDVLLALLNDPEMPHHFLLMGGYREEHKANLHTFFQQVDNAKVVATDILLQNIQEADIHSLLTTMLSLEPEDTSELATIVYHKTDGNPFFVLQYLDALYRWKLLTFDELSFKWTWNLSLIRSNTNLADNVAEMVTQRLNSVSPDVRRLLQLAACLGFQIDRSLLEQVYSNTTILVLEEDASEANREEEKVETRSSSFDQVASHAEDDSLLESAGTSIKFSHDRIRQLAYELVPAKGHDSVQIHYELGSYLKESFGDSRSSPYLLLAADQLNRGSACSVQSNSDRMGLIKLNLEASKVARQRSGEALVVNFLSKAASLMNEKDWEDSYDMTLEIHNRLAEIESGRGHLQQAQTIVDAILEHAKQPSDKASALAVQARCLAFSMKTVEAVEKAREALAVLEVELKCPNVYNFILESFRVKHIVKNKTDQDFLDLPMMSSKLMKKAMRILITIAVYGFGADDRITTGLAFTKMLEITLKHGICQTTASTFGGYAQILAAVKKREQAYRFAQLAMNFTCKENVASTTSFIHGLCMHLKRPLALSLEPTLNGYRSGIQNGDVFFGAICLSKYMQLYLLCGLPLKPFSSDCKNFAQQLKLLNQERMVTFVIPNLLLALNLTGQSTDYRELSWEQGTEIEIIGRSELQVEALMKSPAYSLMFYHKLFIAVVMNDIDLIKVATQAISSLKKSQKRFMGTHMANYLYALLDGLSGLALFETNHHRKHFRQAKRAIKELKDMQTVNSVPLLELLLARRAAVVQFSKKEKVKALYERAITLLVRSGFTHYSAMAYECAGRYMVHHGDDFWAKDYLQQSLVFYGEWNASIKVDQLQADFREFLLGKDSTHRIESGAIRGRKRFQSISSALLHRNTETNLAVGQTVEPENVEENY